MGGDKKETRRGHTKQPGGKDEGKGLGEETWRGDKQRGEYEVGRKDKGHIKWKQGHEERRQDETIREEPGENNNKLKKVFRNL